jgi:hypothetical protein
VKGGDFDAFGILLKMDDLGITRCSFLSRFCIWQSRQTHWKGSEYNIAAYPSHIKNNGIILNMSTPHMPLFQIGVTFFEYAGWIYSGMSAVSPITIPFLIRPENTKY